MERQHAQSPARNSSITRIAGNLMNRIRKSASKGPSSQTSGGANNSNVNNTVESANKESA